MRPFLKYIVVVLKRETPGKMRMKSSMYSVLKQGMQKYLGLPRGFSTSTFRFFVTFISDCYTIKRAFICDFIVTYKINHLHLDVFKDPCEMTNTGKWLQQKILFKFLYCGSASGFWLLPLALSAAAALHRVSFCELLLQFLVNSWSYHYIFLFATKSLIIMITML